MSSYPSCVCVQIVFPLVFREILGLMQLPDVVVKRRGAREIDVFAERGGARLRQLGDHHGMVERPRRLLFELFEQLRVRAGQLAQPEHGEAVEHAFEHGQEGEEEDGGHDAAEQAETHLREDSFQPRRFGGQADAAPGESGNFQKEDDHVHGDDDDEPDPHDLETGLCLISEKDRDHARRKGDDEGGIDAVGGHRRIGKGVDDKQQNSAHHVDENRVPPPHQNEHEQGAQRHRAGVDVQVISEKEGHQNAEIEHGKDERDVPAVRQHPPVFEKEIEIQDPDEQQGAEHDVQKVRPIFAERLPESAEVVPKEQQPRDQKEYDEIERI